jgi:protein O-mannosyl-transferase
MNVLLAFALVKRMTSPAAAFAAAAIWAVHPLSTESVTNIVGRADLLAAFAVLGGFLLYLKSRDADGVRRAAWLAGVVVIAGAGLFSKESAVVLVPVIALYEAVWWARGRSASALRWAGVALTPLLLLAWMQRSAVLGASSRSRTIRSSAPDSGWAG